MFTTVSTVLISTIIRSMIASQMEASQSLLIRLYQPFGSNCVQKITEPFTLRDLMISRSSRVCSVDTGLNRNSSRIKRSIFWYALITFFSVPSPCATASSFNRSGRRTYRTLIKLLHAAMPSAHAI